MTQTQLTGDALLAKIAEFDSTVTATVKATACGYLKDNGKVDYVEFYTQLLEAKGLTHVLEDEDGVSTIRSEANERWGKEAVDAFCEIWDEDYLDSFEDVYQGEYESGAKFAQELVEDCYGIPNSFPCFVEIDWEATWQNLSYDYTEENGFFFRNF